MTERRWSNEFYKILQVVPCEGVFAVYAIEDEANPGKFNLDKEPIKFLALVEITTEHYVTVNETSTRVTQTDTDNDVVGLTLLPEGWFEVCNQADNFAGYCREGDDISECIGCLNLQNYPLIEGRK